MATRSVDILINAKNNATGAFRQAQGSVDAFQSTIGRARNVLGALGLTLTFTAGIRAFKSLIADSIEAMSATFDLANSLNITTESLIGMQHAASLSGVEATEFSGALEKMTKNIGQAAIKGGESAEMMARFGLNVKELANLGVDQQFSAIAEAISQIENPAERAAAAVAFFGKSGQQMINTLSGGAMAIEAMRADAEALGMTFTTMEAAQVKALGDSFTRLEGSVKGAAMGVTTILAPALKAMADDAAKDVRALGVFVESMLIDAFIPDEAEGMFRSAMAMNAAAAQASMTDVSAAEAAAELAAEVTKLTDKLYDESAAFGLSSHQASVNKLMLEGATEAQLAEARGLAAALDAADQKKKADEKLITTGDSLIAQLQKKIAIEQAQQGGSSSEAAARQMEIMELATLGANETQLAFIQGLANELTALEAVTEAEKKRKEELEKMSDAAKQLVEKTRTPLQEFQTEMAEARKLFEKGLLTDEQFKQAGIALRKELDDAGKQSSKDVEKAISSAPLVSRFLTNQPGSANTELGVLKELRTLTRQEVRLLERLERKRVEVELN